MIGVKKNIIIVNMGVIDIVMFNPVIISKSGMYDTEEGCLSLDGVRKTIRYEEIEVEYYDFNWKKQRQKLSGWTAQFASTKLIIYQERLYSMQCKESRKRIPKGN